ncbi:21112_t:CDS:2, partial [Gigaspora margarita]
ISLQLDNPDIVAKNAVGQNNTKAKIKKATQQISEYKQAIKLIKKLKCYTKAQAKLRAKNQKQLDDEGIVKQYDKPG